MEGEKAIRGEEARQEESQGEKTAPSREELLAGSLVLVWGSTLNEIAGFPVVRSPSD